MLLDLVPNNLGRITGILGLPTLLRDMAMTVETSTATSTANAASIGKLAIQVQAAQQGPASRSAYKVAALGWGLVLWALSIRGCSIGRSREGEVRVGAWVLRFLLLAGVQRLCVQL